MIYSDDDDAPEAVSLSSSKKAISTKNAAIRKAQTDLKLKKKEKNRDKDRRLKEQAASRDDLEARMERAMKEAHEESGESSEEDLEAEEFTTSAQKIRFSDDDIELDSEGSGLDSEGVDADHLPDHLFAAAFSQQPSPKTLKAKPTPPPKKHKSKRKKQSAKDVVLGSRTIRTLSVPLTVAKTVPTKKVEKFISKALHVKGTKSKDRWERRPANIGVMRQTGPAANFVRTS